MKFQELTPMMETNDLQATISFYTTVLGFEVRDTFEDDGKTVWCNLYKDTVDIMFSLPNAVMNYGKILLSGSLYIYVDDVDGLWEKIKDKADSRISYK